MVIIKPVQFIILLTANLTVCRFKWAKCLSCFWIRFAITELVP